MIVCSVMLAVKIFAGSGGYDRVQHHARRQGSYSVWAVKFWRGTPSVLCAEYTDCAH